MKTSKLGQLFLQKQEWVRRSKRCGWNEANQRYYPYRDYKGFWTFGCGHLIGDGKAYPGPEWWEGKTEEETDELFARDLVRFENGIQKHVLTALEQKGDTLAQNEYDALCSFAFNEGPEALNPVKNSAIRALLQGRRDLVPSLLLPWDISAGQHDPGLRNRRKAEGYLFSHPYEETGESETGELPAPLIDLLSLYRELEDQHRAEDIKDL